MSNIQCVAVESSHPGPRKRILVKLSINLHFTSQLLRRLTKRRTIIPWATFIDKKWQMTSTSWLFPLTLATELSFSPNWNDGSYQSRDQICCYKDLQPYSSMPVLLSQVTSASHKGIVVFLQISSSPLLQDFKKSVVRVTSRVARVQC